MHAVGKAEAPPRESGVEGCRTRLARVGSAELTHMSSDDPKAPGEISLAALVAAAAAAPPAPPAAPTNPQLTSRLKADYEAVRNDLDQAQSLAQDFQAQLAGKTNEVAHFKALLEKSKTDLERLESNVVELRQERHRLANMAMRSMAFEEDAKRAVLERDQLRAELETLRKVLAQRTAEAEYESHRQQDEIVRLRAALDTMRKSQAGAPSRTEEVNTEKRLAELAAVVQRLQAMVDSKGGAPEPAKPSPGKAASTEHIDISFSS
jgi:hypothetical protein